MKILFCCPSLEAGRDGVGDYTMRLAEELTSQGHECLLVALNDKFLNPGLCSPDDVGAINRKTMVVRLSSNESWRRRIDVVQKLVYEFQPDWLSLQYVPYGFQIKGLPLLLPRRMAVLAPLVNWHLMFHEIWAGFTPHSPLRHKLVGFLQRSIARNLVRYLHPKVVHTSNPLYVELLSRDRIKVERLPLFGNVRVDNGQRGWMQSRLLESGITEENRKDWLIAGMFASCYPEYPLELQIHRVASRAVKSGQKLAFFGIGGGEGTGAVWENRIRKVAPHAVIRHFGRQEESKVSAFLSCLDLAMPTTPMEFLGKSGVAASMALHGALLDTSYRMKFNKYKHLGLADYSLDDLFWPLKKVASEMLSSLAASTAPILSK